MPHVLPIRETEQGWNVVRIHYENIPDYDYEDAAKGQSEEQIRQELEIDWMATHHKRVYPEFGQMHIAAEELKFYPNLPLVLGFDMPGCPACVPTQINPWGQWQIWEPLVGLENVFIGDYEFGSQMWEYLEQDFARPHRKHVEQLTIHCWGDPAGNAKMPASKATKSRVVDIKSAYETLLSGDEIEVGYNDRGEAITEKRPGFGWRVRSGEMGIIARQKAVRGRLTFNYKGRPSLLVDPRANTIIEGFMGAYHYPEKADGTFGDEPEKNWHSHPMNALEYAASGLWGSGPKGSQDDDRAWGQFRSQASGRRE